MTAKILLIGNIGSGKSTLARGLARALGWPQLGIDECRKALGDGSSAREVAAWAFFLEQAQQSTHLILDCSGTGPFAHLLRHALQHSGLPVFTYWLQTPIEVCLQRVEGRSWSTPYPDFSVPLNRVLSDIAAALEREARDPRRWPGPVRELDGRLPPDELQRAVMDHLRLSLPSATSPARTISPNARDSVSLTDIAERMTRWADSCPGIEALLFYGSFARGQSVSGSDLDVALLVQPTVPTESVADAMKDWLGTEVTQDCTLQNGRQRVFWLGSTRLKLDLLLCSDPQELTWIAEARDVPAPRLSLAFARSLDRIQPVLAMASRDVPWTTEELRARADLEVEKFLTSLDASQRANRLGDEYAAYFQYNLALHQLVRLIQLARGGASQLYLPRGLLEQHLSRSEAERFRTLAASLHDSGLAVQSQRLSQFFLGLCPELNDKLGTSRTAAELSRMLLSNT